jgi:hypothetical protein
MFMNTIIVCESSEFAVGLSVGFNVGCIDKCKLYRIPTYNMVLVWLWLIELKNMVCPRR